MKTGPLGVQGLLSYTWITDCFKWFKYTITIHQHVYE